MQLQKNRDIVWNCRPMPAVVPGISGKISSEVCTSTAIVPCSAKGMLKISLSTTVEAKRESTFYPQSSDQAYQRSASTSTEERSDPVCLTTYEGHIIYFKMFDGKWEATSAKENLPPGFTNEVKLPVYIDSAMTIEQLLKGTTDFQKRHIHVKFRPSKREPKGGFIYIGNIGLRGGGVSSSSLNAVRDLEPLGNYLPLPDLSNYTVGEAIVAVAKACEYHASDWWMTNRSRGPFCEGQPKCNLFVFEVLKEIGLYAASNGDSGLRRLTLRIPTASDWANDRVYCFNRTRSPSPGCIVAEKFDYENATGHVGIVVNYGETVSSSSFVGGRLVINDFGFRSDPEKLNVPCGGHKTNAIYLEHNRHASSISMLRSFEEVLSLQWY